MEGVGILVALGKVMKTNKRTIRREGKVALLSLERDGSSLFAVSYPHVVGKDENGNPVELKQRMTQQFMLEVEAIRFYDRMRDFYAKLLSGNPKQS